MGFTAGAFDLLHPGHVYLINECRKQCDYLIIGLHINPNTDRALKNKPIQSSYERYMQLSALRSVDKIIPYDTEDDLYNLLATQNIDMRFLGSDYVDRDFTGKDLCDQLNIKVLYIPRLHKYSSTELRQRMNLYVNKYSSTELRQRMITS